VDILQQQTECVYSKWISKRNIMNRTIVAWEYIENFNKIHSLLNKIKEKEYKKYQNCKCRKKVCIVF
jgi:hypothetical protein